MILTILSTGVMTPARTIRAASIEELVTYVQELTRQLETLRRQLEVKPFTTDIRYGTTNNQEVRRLQQFLIGRGYLSKEFVTGNFFILTKRGLQQFQRAQNVPVTGVLDKRTREKINGLLKREEAEKVGKSDTKPLVVQATTSTQTVFEEVRPEHRLDKSPVYEVREIEQLIFLAINGERKKNGLSVLTWNESVALVARAHSVDQAGDNAIITNPEGACVYPFIRHEGFASGFKVGDRLEQANIDYRLAGENIIIFPITKELIYQAEALAPACLVIAEEEEVAGEMQEAARARIAAMLDVRIRAMAGQEKLNWINREWKGVQEIANESATEWMNSPGHRHNILTGEFAETGIGVAMVNDYIIVTQVFLKKP